MNQIYIIIALISFIWTIIFWLSIIVKYKNKELSKSEKKEFRKKYLEIQNIKSNREKMIFYDKFFHNILLKLGYTWTFWEILKKKPVQINNLNKVWELHKIRNKLVHELDVEIENLEKKLKEYEYQIETIIY